MFTLSPPSVLSFKSNASSTQNSKFVITNVSENPILFKIKTTTPKSFTVQPNSGRINPGEAHDIHVSYVTTKDKFLILATDYDNFEKSECHDKPDTFWHDLEKDKRHLLSEKRIKCIYDKSPENSSEGLEAKLEEANKRIKQLEKSLSGSSFQDPGVHHTEYSLLSSPLGVLLVAMVSFVLGLFLKFGNH